MHVMGTGLLTPTLDILVLFSAKKGKEEKPRWELKAEYIIIKE
jgi:hypothetical protein